MPFVSVADELAFKSFTVIENKFITKYLKVLDPESVRVYLYALYLSQNSNAEYNLSDLAQSLNITEEAAIDCFRSLEELELILITSQEPFEIKILGANPYGKPKKYKPEKYADFTKNAQNALSGRMIGEGEYRRYFEFMENDGFDEYALLMIINYCISLQGNKIGAHYISKVVLSFLQDGIVTAKKVEERLSDYTSSTPALLKLFSALSIKKKPDIEDDKLYKKWTKELGFEDEAIICAAKHFKAKSTEKIDYALEELYKNRKFDKKEIDDYCKNKNSLYSLSRTIRRNLGVYAQDDTPFVENYVGVWSNFGYTADCLETISAYCFTHGKNGFAEMDAFVRSLYDEGIVTEDSVNEYIDEKNAEDALLRKILENCGLSRKIVPWDRDSLSRWLSWNFSDEMLLEAARRSASKSNPMAYMNSVLAAWKAEGIFEVAHIPAEKPKKRGKLRESESLHDIFQAAYERALAEETAAADNGDEE